MGAGANQCPVKMVQLWRVNGSAAGDQGGAVADTSSFPAASSDARGMMAAETLSPSTLSWGSLPPSYQALEDHS